jgi:uncharacterized metal-binding protein YceD (DUF177 family)
MSIKISIGSLKEGSQQLTLQAAPVELGLQENIIKGNIDIFLDLFKTDNQLDIQAKITGLLELECGRCLDLFEKEFEQVLELVYVQQSPVYITNDIREMVMLAVPMRRIPYEKEDGSCSWCGKTKEYWHRFIVDEEELEK